MRGDSRGPPGRLLWRLTNGGAAHRALIYKYPVTPSVNGTSAAAEGYAIPGKAKPPTAADPNGTSNCQEFNTMLKACLRQNGLVQVD